MSHTVGCCASTTTTARSPQHVVQRPHVVLQSAKMIITDDRVDSESPIQIVSGPTRLRSKVQHVATDTQRFSDVGTQ